MSELYVPSKEPKRAELYVWSGRALRELRNHMDRGSLLTVAHGEIYDAEARRREAMPSYRELAPLLRDFGNGLIEVTAALPRLGPWEIDSRLRVLGALLRETLSIRAIVARENAPRIVPYFSKQS